ncbi:MAG: hypothetical protein AAF414_09430 [Pseudomonadota bacterium]
MGGADVAVAKYLLVSSVLLAASGAYSQIEEPTFSDKDCEFIHSYGRDGSASFISDFLDRVHSDRSNWIDEFPVRDSDVELIKFAESVHLGILVDQDIDMYSEVTAEVQFWLEIADDETPFEYDLGRPVERPLLSVLIGDVRLEDRELIEEIYPDSETVSQFLEAETSPCMVLVNTELDSSIRRSSVIADGRIIGRQIMDCVSTAIVVAFGLSPLPASSSHLETAESQRETSYPFTSHRDFVQRERLMLRLLYSEEIEVGSDLETTMSTASSIIDQACPD